MAYSETSVHPVQNGDGSVTIVDIDARGGTRRQRAAAISAVARKYPGTLRRFHVSYSETYGFLPATYARYEVVK